METEFDWNTHWAGADRESLDEMRAAGRRWVDRLATYHDEFPASLADVGCGPAFMLFGIAERHPETELVGYDRAPSVLRENRRLAAERGLDVTFRRGVLPAFEPDRRFECVTCLATLHYVREPERAIRRLYDAVAAGGRLICNYPNRHTRRAYRDDPATDPDRFRPLLDGESLLSYRRIRETLGRDPRSFWKAVGADDWRSLGRTNPCVVVERPP
ncbi:MAG: trans-aconitate 2-methyltransferase [Halobaculum sp.]